MSRNLRNTIDRDRLHTIRQREMAHFAARTPGSAALCDRASGHLPAGVPMAWMKGLYRTPTLFVDRAGGPTFHDVDGNARPAASGSPRPVESL